MSNKTVRKSKPKTQNNTPSKKIKSNIESLEAYSSTNALNNTLMTTVKQLYKNRDSTNIRSARTALDLLKSNSKSDFNKFKTKITTISKNLSNTKIKQNIKKRYTN